MNVRLNLLYLTLLFLVSMCMTGKGAAQSSCSMDVERDAKKQAYTAGGTTGQCFLSKQPKDQFEKTLVLTVQQKDVRSAEFLLANKADVNQKTSAGCPILTVAAMDGHRAMVKLLLAYKADATVLYRNLDASTWAHLAGHSDIAKDIENNFLASFAAMRVDSK